jgi:hypothetical protein
MIARCFGTRRDFQPLSVATDSCRPFTHCTDAAGGSPPTVLATTINRHIPISVGLALLATAFYTVIDSKTRKMLIAGAGILLQLRVRGSIVEPLQFDGTMPLLLADPPGDPSLRGATRARRSPVVSIPTVITERGKCRRRHVMNCRGFVKRFPDRTRFLPTRILAGHHPGCGRIRCGEEANDDPNVTSRLHLMALMALIRNFMLPFP